MLMDYFISLNASMVSAPLLPVACAQLVGLQCVQLTEHLVGVTADRVSGNGDRLDGVVGIDDEGCAVCNAVLVQDAQVR